MSYFAEIDGNGIVKRVIVADKLFIDSGLVGDPLTWIETFIDGSQRKNYAGIGHKYDSSADAFIPPQPYSSWTLDEISYKYQPPIQPPQGISTTWDEKSGTWVTSSVEQEKIIEESIKI